MSRAATDHGRRAEAAVAHYLQQRGHTLLEKNWRTRWCEIDLITQHQSAVYFIEVKYRQNALYGSGLDYITPRKARQMHFAADLWLSNNTSVGNTCSLAAAEVSGRDFVVTAWLSEL